MKKDNSKKTLQIVNARLINNDKEVLKNIYIVDGKIKRIDNNIYKSSKHVDARGKFVIPGLIDPHVHARDFELAYKEDFFTASKAAAAGGITTFLDMPNTKPATVTLELLKKKRELARKSIVNYGFHFGGNFYAEGTAANKLFMNVSTGKMVIDDKNEQENFFRNSKLVSIHAEQDKVREAVELSNKFKTRLYLCHISLKSEIDYLKKKKNKNIYMEVTPHHLFLTKNDEKKLGAFGMMKPGLKTKNDQNTLWDAIKSGMVDTIGTDHAPHTKAEKRGKGGKPAPFGVPGLETVLPLLLDAVNKGKLKLTDIVRLMAKNPAKIFRIKNKGEIKAGYDADLTILDMKKKKKVIENKLFTKCKWSPFRGMMLKGWPVMTIVNGNIIYDDRKKDNKKINNIKAREVEII